jgi:hypothetical protein
MTFSSIGRALIAPADQGAGGEVRRSRPVAVQWQMATTNDRRYCAPVPARADLAASARLLTERDPNGMIIYWSLRD